LMTRKLCIVMSSSTNGGRKSLQGALRVLEVRSYF
jgi:hypothetical protein